MARKSTNTGKTKTLYESLGLVKNPTTQDVTIKSVAPPDELMPARSRRKSSPKGGPRGFTRK